MSITAPAFEEETSRSRSCARAAGPPLVRLTAAAPVVDVIVPVYNEERDLEPSVRRLRGYLDERFPFEARVTVADNGSTDGTWAIARRLAGEMPGVRATRLAGKGRGRAVSAAWLASDAAVVAYMDVDLSTDLDALLPLVAPLVSGHSDVAIGSRLARGARVVRGPRRELISRCYNLLLRLTLGARFGDAQCGFKALRADVARRVLPAVRDREWFFDTELLVLAERAGLRIHEVPVDWVDDPDSKVDILATALADLRGIWRIRRRPRSMEAAGEDRPASGAMRQLGWFAVIGVLSTIAYVSLYWLLRGAATPAIASAVALLATTVANTAANRRLTFGVRGRERMARDQLAGLVALAAVLALTTASVLALQAAAPDAGRPAEVAVLAAAGGAASILRFALLRTWLATRR